jgi:hypothetical protein
VNFNQLSVRIVLLGMLMLSLATLSRRLLAQTGTCSGSTVTLPFTDVQGSNIFFCSIAEAFFSGLTNGTSATTYSPSDPVPREQMAAFVTRTLDQSLKRGSRRAALGQFWVTSKLSESASFDIPSPMNLLKSDGTNIYITYGSGVVRVPASGPPTGVEANYAGMENSYGIAITPNEVYVTGRTNPGKLYRFLRNFSSATVNAITSSLGAGPTGIAYDGAKLWTANAEGHSISIYNPTTTTTTTIPGFNNPFGILYDGTNIWVTNYGNTTGNTLVKLDSNANIIQTVTVGQGPAFPIYDGTNIWVPNYNANSISVVRAATGQVLATSDGQRAESAE